MSRSILKTLSWLLIAGLAGSAAVILGVYLYFAPQLPDTDELRNIELQTPLRIYTADHQLITEIGEKRRTPLRFQQIPDTFINALLASEDDGFFQHYGIDVKGLLRATLELILSGEKKSGGSTITMQVAKNYYLSNEKTYIRKIRQILLAIKIEQTFSKEEILELYVNKIYLGKRAYGFEAAAQVYYGKPLKQLDLAQTAMVAGLPQAPSANNPINSPTKATKRRNYVLKRMLQLGHITEQQYTVAKAAPITAVYHGPTSDISAPYVAEVVRKHMEAQYGEKAYTDGYKVYTSIDSKRQRAANVALQSGILQYDRSHGLRTKPEILATEKTGNTAPDFRPPWTLTSDDKTNWSATIKAWKDQLGKEHKDGILTPAIVAHTDAKGAWVLTHQGEFRFINMKNMQWAAPYINVNAVGKKPRKPSDVVAIGQKIWVEEKEDALLLSQKPEAEGALISLNPNNGAIQAMVGGFSQSSNQFNRVNQADRQPGSAFKPFVYSAALSNGFTPASIINDAPVVFEDRSLESTWRPENYNGKFYGPTRLRKALYRSQNLVSIRILKAMGARNVVDFTSQLGLPKDKLNADLSLALGASGLTPQELATGYAALANGGFAIEPYMIERIETDKGDILFQAQPKVACRDCVPIEQSENQQEDNDSATDTHMAQRVMEPRVNFLINSMLQDVIRRGTGKKAMQLGRRDLAGKTGTTNDQKDAWFSGYNQELVTTVWVGFDQPKTLGRRAFGGSVALPIWIDYMKVALEGVPETSLEQPNGIVTARIDPESGLLAAPGQRDAIFEYFRKENVPKETAVPATIADESASNGGGAPEQIF